MVMVFKKYYKMILNYYQLLEDRKETILKSIEEQGKLTYELRDKIINSIKLREIEDLYLPYKTKRVTKAEKAKKLGVIEIGEWIEKIKAGDPTA